MKMWLFKRIIAILVFTPGEREVLKRIEALEKQFKELKMALREEFDALLVKVTEEETVEDSMITLLTGIKAQLDTLAGQATVTPEEVKALADKIGTDKDKMAAAIVANTPA